ncbi:MAG: CBS domain-containing protein [Gemmatimonadaceae bacterium]
MTTFALILLLATLVGCLTAAATAVRSVSRIWLRHWTEQQLAGTPGAEPVLDRPGRWLFAAGTGIAAIVFTIGAVIGLRETVTGAVEQILMATGLLMIVGQLLPRALGQRWATSLVPALVPALSALEWLYVPFRKVSALFVARRAHAEAAGAGHDAHDALEDLLREGELEGVGEASESAIISGVVEFGEKLAIEVMTMRADIIAVDRAMPAAEIARIVSQSKYSRIPVIDGDLDHVAGLVHSFDVLADPGRPVRALRRVAMVPAATPCHELMRSMLREHVHQAIIQGVLGETLGLVTLEDLVEELVGDISDEHDEPSIATL